MMRVEGGLIKEVEVARDVLRKATGAHESRRAVEVVHPRGHSFGAFALRATKCERATAMASKSMRA